MGGLRLVGLRCARCRLCRIRRPHRRNRRRRLCLSCCSLIDLESLDRRSSISCRRVICRRWCCWPREEGHRGGTGDLPYCCRRRMGRVLVHRPALLFVRWEERFILERGFIALKMLRIDANETYEPDAPLMTMHSHSRTALISYYIYLYTYLRIRTALVTRTRGASGVLWMNRGNP